MGEDRATVSADSLPTANADWREAIRRAGQGETTAVIARGQHVADVVPAGELDRLRETIEVLSDQEAMRNLQVPGVAASSLDEIESLVADRIARERP